MKALGYIGAFLGGAVAGAALGVLLAPEAGENTRNKLTDAVKDFCDKHDIKLSRKQVEELVDEVQDADIA
jgi:gas vesicle protein